MKRWAVERDIPVEQPESLVSPEVRERLAEYAPDVVVVVAYGLILPPEVLEIPPRGCVNVHASLLPRHRGAAPMAWTILEGDETTGVTTMLMDEGMDTGPILMQERVEVGSRETRPELEGRLDSLGAELLSRTLEGWEAGEIEPTPQDPGAATYAPMLEKEDGRIDWSRRAVEIDRRVRALTPWPGTFTSHEGERLRIWWVEPLPASTEPPGRGSLAAGTGSERPGTVVEAGDRLRIVCGEGGRIDIAELQRAGGRRMAAADFLRGRSVEPGTVLGE